MIISINSDKIITKIGSNESFIIKNLLNRSFGTKAIDETARKKNMPTPRISIGLTAVDLFIC